MSKPVKKQKVLFTSHTANFSKFNRPFMRWFKDQGWVVHYASAGEEEVLDTDKHFTIPFERSPFKINNLRAISKLKKIIDRENYDIIHTHTPMGSVVTRLAARKSRKKGTRVIYTAHGFHFFKGAPIINWVIYYPIEKLMARFTDTLITINKEDYERAKNKFNTRVEYVPGVGLNPAKLDSKFSEKNKIELRKSLGLQPNDFVIIYTAELNNNKNQTMAIKAIKRLSARYRNIKLLLAGQDSIDGYHRSIIQKMKLESQVTLLGYRNDIPQLLMISDVAISTSKREGLPVNIIESLRSGLPVIVTNVRGNADLVINGKNGFLVALGDVESLCKNILRLKNNATLRNNLIRQAKKSSEPFLMSKIIPTMENIYVQRKRTVHLLASCTFSGAENVACGIIEKTKNNIDSYYVSPFGPISKTLKNRGIPYTPLSRLTYKEVYTLIKKIRPDTIHAHDFRASVISSFFHKRIEIISHIHRDSDWFDQNNIKSLLYLWRSRYFNKIIIVAESIKETKLFMQINPAKILVVRNTIDTSAVRRAAGRGVSKNYDLIFCGRLEEVKQPLDFIRIVYELKKEIPNINAVMIGDGYLLNDCVKLIKDLKLGESIDMAGFQNNPYKYMKSSKFLIMTSKIEGMPMVLLEAEALGLTPIIYPFRGINNSLKKYAVNDSSVRSIVDFVLQNKKLKLRTEE